MSALPGSDRRRRRRRGIESVVDRHALIGMGMVVLAAAALLAAGLVIAVVAALTADLLR